MKPFIKFSMRATACAAACFGLSAAAQQGSAQCEQAWAAYNQLKSDATMEPSQYPLTVEGAAVRSACGANALPAPPGSDIPPLPIIRDHVDRPGPDGPDGQPGPPGPPIRPIPTPLRN
jgi:hypothetical protein